MNENRLKFSVAFKYLPDLFFCSMTTWRWVNDDRFLIFEEPIPLTSRTNGPDKGKMDTYRLYRSLTSLKPSACMSGTWRLEDEVLWGEEHPPCVLFSFSATFYLISAKSQRSVMAIPVNRESTCDYSRWQLHTDGLKDTASLRLDVMQM